MNIDSFKSLPKPILKLSTFHKDLIAIWIEMRPLIDKTKPKTFYDIRQQAIWGNKYIKLKGKRLVYKHWIDSNIVYDLLPDDRSICELIILTKLNKTQIWIIV